MMALAMKSAKRVELEQRARELGYELEWYGSGWKLVGDKGHAVVLRPDGRTEAYYGNLEIV
jgi:hypothetical protein